ncbi:unnamed protein product [Vitrella brassicaformis CCMP3155]|uniref:Uncharacterized protein n=1 Tax=Vitrella brassicaformis (strain CCMP3155) TaxID=1169540 RepID=A0A0G4EYH8_VITBC|nr:unnamed protein product [Vitrella brassicaformis CCMP3155]|eukprot:CEM04412.1 unnamed protein product [Vitrella brassicaformis CCMP3155]
MFGLLLGELALGGAFFLAANFIPEKRRRKLLKGNEAFLTAIQEENAREAQGANHGEATREDPQEGQGEADEEEEGQGQADEVNEANDEEEELQEENERTGLLTGEANVWATGDSEEEGSATSESQGSGQTDEPEYRELVFVDPVELASDQNKYIEMEKTIQKYDQEKLEYHARAEERRLCLERQIEVNRFEMNWMYCKVDRMNTELKNQIINKDRKIRELEQMGDDKDKECSRLLQQNTALVQTVAHLGRLLASQPTAAHTEMDTDHIPGPSASGGCETEKANSVCGEEEAATQQASEASTGPADTNSSCTGPMRSAASEIESTGLVRLSGKTDNVQQAASASSSSAQSTTTGLHETEDKQLQEMTPKAEIRGGRKRISNVGMKSSRGRE